MGRRPRGATGLARIAANVAGDARQLGPEPLPEQVTPGCLPSPSVADIPAERAVFDTADGPLGGPTKPGRELRVAFGQGALIESVCRGPVPIVPEVRRIDQRGSPLHGGGEPGFLSGVPEPLEPGPLVRMTTIWP